VNGVSALRSDDIEASFVGSDLEAPAGSTRPTSCSTKFNRTWSGACGATRRRTDRLPARDRARIGGPADIQVFSPSASFLFDTRRLTDVMARRTLRRAAEDGRCRSSYRMCSKKRGPPATAAGGDAATIVAVGVIYERSGGRRTARPATAEHARLGRQDGQPRPVATALSAASSSANWLDRPSPGRTRSGPRPTRRVATAPPLSGRVVGKAAEIVARPTGPRVHRLEPGSGAFAPIRDRRWHGY